MMVAVVLLASGATASAEDRGAAQVVAAYPYASTQLPAKGALREPPLRNLQSPVLATISPDGSSPGLALPERRSAVDHMLQSHEFSFGRNRRAENFAGARMPSGTAIDLDAVKLRISRDKVIVKGEWLFN